MQVDVCRGTLLLSSSTFGEIPSWDFTIKNNLDSARLVITVQVFNPVNGTIIPIDIYLTWTPTSNTETLKLGSRFSSPGTLVVNRTRSIAEQNALITGTVATPYSTMTAFEGYLLVIAPARCSSRTATHTRLAGVPRR